MRVLIAAGGTGGHLFPGIALAREIQRQTPETGVLFVGTARGLERKVLEQEGYDLAVIRVEGLIGRGWWKVFKSILMLPVSLLDAYRILDRYKPVLVIGIGGYASGPIMLLAGWVGLPCVMLEPNAVPGWTNRLLTRIGRVDLVISAFGESRFLLRGSKRFMVLGNPVRRSLLTAEAPAGKSGETLLVLGGSQGAHTINRAMTEALGRIRKRKPDLAVIHQTGSADLEVVRKAYQEQQMKARVEPFLFDMGGAYQQADLVLSRAGATTLAELTACGKPAILVPYPHATHGHQLKNAMALAEHGAALVIEERDLNGRLLADQITALFEDREQLLSMALKSRTMGNPDATERIVDECLALIGRMQRSTPEGARGV